MHIYTYIYIDFDKKFDHIHGYDHRVLCSTYHLENSCLERVEKLDMAALLDPTCKISLMFEETV